MPFSKAFFPSLAGVSFKCTPVFSASIFHTLREGTRVLNLRDRQQLRLSQLWASAHVLKIRGHVDALHASDARAAESTSIDEFLFCINFFACFSYPDRHKKHEMAQNGGKRRDFLVPASLPSEECRRPFTNFSTFWGGAWHTQRRRTCLTVGHYLMAGQPRKMNSYV